MCYTADRRKKGLEKGGYRESLTDTAADKGYTEMGGGQRSWGLGGAAREAREEESWFCFQKPVISFPSWWARPEGSGTKEAGLVDMESVSPPLLEAPGLSCVMARARSGQVSAGRSPSRRVG